MGVRHLQLYFEVYSRGHACNDVSISRLVEDFRQENGNQQPEIVVDAYTCIRKIYGAIGRLDWVCGGQFSEFVHNTKNFIQSFTDLGIKLTFFFDGVVEPSKRKAWAMRRIQNMTKVHAVFDSLKKGQYVAPKNDDFILPEALGYVMSHIILESGCQVCMSQRECDGEMASYAKQNNCLAILSQDSDFAIYQNGAKYFLSLMNLNMDKMSTLKYDKNILAKELFLDVSSLPIVASLMGNDFIPFKDLQNFHSRLSGPNVAYLLPAIASYVRKLPEGDDSFSYLLKVSRDAFGTEDRAEDLRKSILSYTEEPEEEQKARSNSKEWDKILAVAQRNFVHMSFPSCIFNILRLLPFNLSTVLEDYRVKTLKPSAILLRKTRQRIYGVLLQQHPEASSKQLKIDEYCMSGPNSLDHPHPVTPEQPPQEVSSHSLLDLWAKKDSFINDKMKLLAWITSEYLFLKKTDLGDLPHPLVSAVCALSFLYRDVEVLASWEVKVFAATVVDVQAMDFRELSALKIQTVNVRGAQLATLFTRSLTHIFWANAVCGSPVYDDDMLHHKIFDGKLFQIKYNAALHESAIPNLMKGSLKNFDLLCAAVIE